MGFSVILVSCAVLGGTFRKDEDFGKSAPFYFCLIMKKFFTLIILCIFSIGVIHADITWTLSDDGTLTISGTDMPNYVYLNYNSPWMSQRDKIKKVVIKHGVTNIGTYAFYFCSNLTSITIPNSVTSIGDYSFNGCKALTSVTIPNSVTSIGKYAFSGCSLMTSIYIPNSVTNIGIGSFSNCKSLKSIKVDEGNRKYDSRNNCNAIIDTQTGSLIAGCENTIIPNTVTSIGKNVFSGCSSLTSINIPNSVMSIGEFAFEDCSSLITINIPNSVTSIEASAFWGCSSLTSVSMSNSVTSIEDNVFRSCISLTSVDIPNSVTSIGDYAFHGCSSITSVNIPNSVTRIGDKAFMGCSDLISFNIPNFVKSIGGSAFEGCSSLTSVSIPNSVTSIGNCAFRKCTSLTSIVIPNSLTNIAPYTFYGCTSLISISIPNSITNIGLYAFSACSSLTFVSIPNSVKEIDYCAFSSCSSLESIYISNSLTSVGYSAFQDCKKLSELMCNALNPPSVEKDVFRNTKYESGVLYVPASSISAYKTANEWRKWKNIQAITEPTNISIANKNENLLVGMTRELKTTITPENATNIVTTWNSSNTDVATVSSEGIVTAKGAGTTVITAKTYNGKTAKYTITVEQPVTAIVLSDATTSLWVGKTKTLTATVTPTTSSNTAVNWSSSNNNVATVSSKGVITAKSKGTCTITCTAADGYGTKNTCEVTVKQQIAEIVISETNASLWVGDTKTITATTTPTTANNTNVSWSSSDDKVATVSSKGVVTAKGQGTCTITCTAADGYGTKSTCEVTVKQQVTKIALSETTASLWVGNMKTITATASPTTASNTTVEWSSSDDNVATVSSEGIVTAKGQGTCTITCTAADGYGTKSTCEITIKQQVTEIALSEATVSLWVGDTKTITATATPTTASNTSVNWSSSDDNVATVSSEGVITANGEGSCIITCTASDGYGTKSTCEITIKQQVTEIALSETNASLWVGETKTLSATVSPATASNTSVEWSSSDENVATVSSEGVITANGEGTCIITCTASDGYGAVSVCEVTVMQQTTSLEDLRFANDKSPVYNMNGQRINKVHAQKGIYIKNGKKYANKN